MRSLYSGVVGLRAHQTKMDVIGDNIANVNTIGFKKSRVNFQDMLAQTIRGASAPQGNRGGVNAMMVGLGVGLGSIDVINTQGNMQNTGKNTDLSIDGDGFFIVKNGNDTFYTRSGTIDVDREGSLVLTNNGLKVAGWTADPITGAINTDPTQVGEIKIPIGASIAAQATSKAVYTKNLDSGGSEPINTSLKVYDSLGNAHNLGVKFYKPTTNVDVTGAVFDTTAGSSKNFDYSVTDANGNLHTIRVKVTENAGAYDWAAYDVVNGVENAIGGATGTGVAVAALQTPGITINDGAGINVNIKYPGATASASPSPGTPTYSTVPANTWQWSVSTTDPTITGITGNGPNTLIFSDKGAYLSGSGALNLTFSNGAATITGLAVDLSGLTQYAGESTANAACDGYTSGSLNSLSIDSNGVISGGFTNGIRKDLGQIALAVFTNPAGLMRQGGSLYRESNNSGTAQIGTSGNGGRGFISPGSLEMSNVDLAQEFTDMITTQRGFQANSKIITTTDEMLNDLVNLKR